MTTLRPDWLAWPETQTLINAFAGKGELRFVGGAVRNAVLEQPVVDVDAATPLLPLQTISIAESSGLKAVPTGIDHGTVTVLVGKKKFEITTLRKDTACDGRHAAVEYTDNWQQDAARRDFTVNALYLSASGELFDYFGGTADAKAGRIRFIGNATERIREDYLRILRFFRFYAHYGQGVADAAALKACADLAAHIGALSGERIQQEMVKLLAAPMCTAVLALMHDSGVLEKTCGFPVANIEAITRLEHIGLTPDHHIRLALLLPDVKNLPALAARWKLSNDHKHHLEMLLTHHIDLDSALAEQKKLLRRIGAEYFKELVFIAWAKDLRGNVNRPRYESLLQLANGWIPPVFPVTGKDLKDKGMTEGKALGDALKKLEEKWEASDYALTQNDLLTSL